MYTSGYQPVAFLGPSLTEVCPGSAFLTFMTLVNTVVRSKDEVAQLNERVTPGFPEADAQFDFIVVGGGAAGSVVASRLSENSGWKVLLLEAGPDEPPGADVPSMVAMFLGTEIDWQYKTENEPEACRSTGGSCSWPRGKNLGGTTVHHGMMYMRGHRKDYDNWGIPGWGWDDVLPFFKKSEKNGEIDRVGREFHGDKGPLNVERFPWQPEIIEDILAAADEVGYGQSEDLNGERITGFTVAQTTSENGVRVSSAAAFLRPARDRKNLQVALNATVTKILFETDSQTGEIKAVGVEYEQGGVQKVAVSRREVIVSGGAVDSPKLLLLSGIGPRQDLARLGIQVVKDLPGVGKNLHNHISYSLSYKVDLPNINDLNSASLDEYKNSLRGPMSSTGMSQFTGILDSSDITSDHPDLQFYFGGYHASCATSGLTEDDGNGREISITPTNVQPLSKGFLRLRSNNPEDKPIITGNYFVEKRDAIVLTKGINLARKLMESEAMQHLKPTLTKPDVPACGEFSESDDYWDCVIRQNTGPENHQAGSCKMGLSDDDLAVVNPRLEVYGVKGLRVADTSIMPQVNSGNTAAPAIMIGERAADFIKKNWNLNDDTDDAVAKAGYENYKPHGWNHHWHHHFGHKHGCRY